MPIVIVTGSAGLVGSESVEFFVKEGLDVVGIDNDMRRVFFGDAASTAWQRERLKQKHGHAYIHLELDVRDWQAINALFANYGKDIAAVIHTAAQPSHDWAAREPHTDFTVNANGTLNLLQATRDHAPDAPFIFTSTNKVYGDRPNGLPFVELEERWEIAEGHEYAHGIPETMSIDCSLHSLFGASKVAADILVQEYGRYFGLKTVCFRAGCLTGPNHSGAQLHGFLAYLMKCALTRTPYTVFGHKAKQVRDNIHSADLIRLFWEFFNAPRVAEVYNVGGGRHANCSMREAIEVCNEITDREMVWSYEEQSRIGDHIWWISDLSKIHDHFPDWSQQFDIRHMLQEIYENLKDRNKLAGLNAKLR